MTEKQLKRKAKELGEQPAFPCRCVIEFSRGRKVNERPFDSGLTKREYFVGLAMQGVIANNPELIKRAKLDKEGYDTTEFCLDAADALLEELVKEEE